jgi:transglutaminase-like putative cysteine protease
MRARIRNETSYTFDPPAKFVIQTLRMTPRNHEGQHVISWRMDVDVDCRLKASEDTFGNVTHTFSVDGPIATMTIVAEGEVETFDNAGIVRGAIERFPAELYCRDTDHTLASNELRAFALECGSVATSPLDALHRLMDTLHETLKIDPDATGDTFRTAADAYAAEAIAATDASQVFVSASRFLGHPSRVVEGYVLSAEGQPKSHSWAESFVEDLGWIGFDASMGACPQESHVRVAVGLDRLGVAPVRFAQISGQPPRVAVRLSGLPGSRRGQFQRQS